MRQPSEDGFSPEVIGKPPLLLPGPLEIRRIWWLGRALWFQGLGRIDPMAASIAAGEDYY